MCSAQGIILKIEDFRERDCRVVLYTRAFGKISVVAKGVKRVEAKLRGNLDVFNFVDIMFVEGSGFFILTGVDLKERFGKLIENSNIYQAAMCAAQTVDALFRENVRDENFFILFYEAIERLHGYSREEKKDAGLFAWLVSKKFQMNVLESQGFASRRNTSSQNAQKLIEMFSGAKHLNVRLTKSDFISIEDMFSRLFQDAFGYKPHSWVPKI